MKLQFIVLEMKGKDRDARRLHSMTFTSFSRAMNWMLTGPVIRSALAMLVAARLTCFWVWT